MGSIGIMLAAGRCLRVIREGFSMVLAVVTGLLHGSPASADGSDRVKTALLSTLGASPASCTEELDEISNKILRSTRRGVLRRVSYRSCGDNVPALLAIPNNAKPHTPLILALHQTSSHGSREVMALDGDRRLGFGDLFFRRGFSF